LPPNFFGYKDNPIKTNAMKETEIKISEFEKQCWLIEATKKGAVKILVFQDITDETLFPEYILAGGNEEEIKKKWKFHSNKFINEIPCGV
jgi:hypothetical protein